MTTIHKIIGLVSATLAGVIGAGAGVTLLLSAVSYWVGGSERVEMRFHVEQAPGLLGGEWIALIVGVAIGFGFGLSVWLMFAKRMGWFTWEEILELLGDRPNKR